MTKYCDVKPILHLLSDKDLLESVNVGAVLQALQHGLYNGEVAPVVHAHWKDNYVFIKNDHTNIECSNCLCDIDVKSDDTEIYRYCPWCGAKMDEKEGK